MSRRAWQRRNIRRNRVVDSSPSINRLNKRSPEACRKGRQDGLFQEWSDDDSSFSPSSGSESDEDYHERRLVTQPMASLINGYKKQSVALSSDKSNSRLQPASDSDSDDDSDGDSGYGSLEDPDERADFYDDLLESFRAEGPTLANHGDGTKKMIEEESNDG